MTPDDAELLERHFIGVAEETDRDLLARRLDADRDLRVCFAQRLRFEAALHRASASAPRPRRVPRRIPMWWLAAAGVLLATGALAALILSHQEGGATPARPLMVATATPAPLAQPGATPHRPAIEPETGHLRDGISVGLSEGHLLLRPGRADDGQLESHAISPEAVITIDGLPGELAAITPGTRLQFATDAEDRVVRIAAVGLILHARIEDIDDDERTVAVHAGRGRKSLQLPLSQHVVISIDGVPAALGLVRIGDRARVQLTVDGSAILGLAVSRRGGEHERHERRDDDDPDRSRRTAPATSSPTTGF